MSQDWFKIQPDFASNHWILRELPEDVASSAIVHAYRALDEFESISGWAGPVFQYGGGFETFYAPGMTNSKEIRDGSLVMTIFATWCAAEESYVLSSETASELESMIDKIEAVDKEHKQLLKISTFGLGLFIEDESYSNWWKGDLWKFDRESRWVLREVIRPQLQANFNNE